MLEKIIIFIIFLGPLIFFHELGHFFFAKLFGVRVMTFSIGFGPRLFTFHWKGTDFTVSLIPLGGYVKMFGDDPLNENLIPEDEKKYAFTCKGKWARFWIVFGGPLANFLLAFFIFYGLLLVGERVPVAKIGLLQQESVFYQKGMRSGDVLTRINNNKVVSLLEMGLEDDEKVTSIEINHNGETKVLALDMSFTQFMTEFFKYPPRFRSPIVLDERGNKYGVTDKKHEMVWTRSLEEMSVTHLKEIYFYRFKNFEPEGKKGLNNHVDYSLERTLKISSEGSNEFFSNLVRNKYFPLDLRIEKIVPSSPAEAAGLKEGDILVSVGDLTVHSFEELRNFIQSQIDGSSVSIKYYRNTDLKTVPIYPVVENSGEEKVVRIGVYSEGEFMPLTYTDGEPMGIGEGFFLAFERTWDATKKTMIGFKKLITNEVPLKSIGGPLAIGKVASDSLNISLSYFFKLMAFISVNLGIINLFPIPVLDGGHILFLTFELFNRGPLSRRKIEIAQQFGVSLLFLLIFAALFNDVSRLFEN